MADAAHHLDYRPWAYDGGHVRPETKNQPAKKFKGMNQRLARIARGIMCCYAVRWKVLRRDPLEREHAARMLSEAVRMRQLARELEAGR